MENADPSPGSSTLRLRLATVAGACVARRDAARVPGRVTGRDARIFLLAIVVGPAVLEGMHDRQLLLVVVVAAVPVRRADRRQSFLVVVVWAAGARLAERAPPGAAVFLTRGFPAQRKAEAHPSRE